MGEHLGPWQAPLREGQQAPLWPRPHPPDGPAPHLHQSLWIPELHKTFELGHGRKGVEGKLRLREGRQPGPGCGGKHSPRVPSLAQGLSLFLPSSLGSRPPCPTQVWGSLGGGQGVDGSNERAQEAEEGGSWFPVSDVGPGTGERDLKRALCVARAWHSVQLELQAAKGRQRRGAGPPDRQASDGPGRGRSERSAHLPMVPWQRRRIRTNVCPRLSTALPQGLTPAQPDCGGQRRPEAGSSSEPPPMPTMDEEPPETKKKWANLCLKSFTKAALRERAAAKRKRGRVQ